MVYIRGRDACLKLGSELLRDATSFARIELQVKWRMVDDRTGAATEVLTASPTFLHRLNRRAISHVLKKSQCTHTHVYKYAFVCRLSLRQPGD